jgi:hypothetical protein
MDPGQGFSLKMVLRENIFQSWDWYVFAGREFFMQPFLRIMFPDL